MCELCLQRHSGENEPVAKISGESSGRRGRERSFCPGLLGASPRHGRAQRHSSSLSLRPSQAFPARARNPWLVSPATLGSLKEGNRGRSKKELLESCRVCLSVCLLWEAVLESGGSQHRWDGFRSVCVLTVLGQMTRVRRCCSKSLICVGNGVAISD